jgi:hypothetical protein
LVVVTIRALHFARQVLEEDETLRTGLSGCVDQRGGYSEFTQFLGKEDQPWFRATVVWVKEPQINQRPVLLTVCWSMRVVDGYNGIVHLVNLHSL